MAPATASVAESIWLGLLKGFDLVSSSEKADAAFADATEGVAPPSTAATTVEVPPLSSR